MYLLDKNPTGITCLETVNNKASPTYIHQFENLNRKIYKDNADVYFNQRCLHNHIIPNLAKIKTPNTSPVSNFTQHPTSITRIKDEIRYLCITKQQPNQQLPHLHLILANS
jgi:hypothetical protein